MAASALNTYLDPKIAAKIIELEHDKGLAVKREDYIAAQQMKEAVERLRAVGVTVSQLEDRKQAAVDSEDYDMAKTLKQEIQNLRSAADAANPLAALTTIGISKVSASQMQTGASGDGHVRSGLDMSLAPPPPSSTPKPVSTAPLSSTKRKASYAFPMACAPIMKRSCTENWDQKGGSDGASNAKIARCPEADVGLHGSPPAIGGSTGHTRNLGKSAWSSLINAHTPGDGIPGARRVVPTADTPKMPPPLHPGETLGAQQDGHTASNAQRAPLAAPSSDVSQQETGSSSSADPTMMSGAASSSCCPSSWCPSSSQDLSSGEEDDSTFEPGPLPKGHSSKGGRSAQAGRGRGTVAVKRKAGARGGHSSARKVRRPLKDHKVLPDTGLTAVNGAAGRAVAVRNSLMV